MPHVSVDPSLAQSRSMFSNRYTVCCDEFQIHTMSLSVRGEERREERGERERGERREEERRRGERRGESFDTASGSGCLCFLSLLLFLSGRQHTQLFLCTPYRDHRPQRGAGPSPQALSSQPVPPHFRIVLEEFSGISC
ncbi:hypothetical protein CesoFtcFv8_015752 [Champsocephalus esox]|uniref:Uncharacterized protein n=1 Tax=Champsocephalus esox TaxID=159716 RepID=A0AAN8GPK6_9TELE|nr:hypothetical protein CesoFtcFv8_015752 [Champsocephalus esox]